MTILGARLLETQSAFVKGLRQSSSSRTARTAFWARWLRSVVMLLTHVLRWAHWWNSTEAMPHDVSNEQVAIELNTN